MCALVSSMAALAESICFSMADLSPFHLDTLSSRPLTSRSARFSSFSSCSLSSAVENVISPYAI